MKTPNKQQSAAVEPVKAAGAVSAAISDSADGPAVSENGEVDVACSSPANCNSGEYADGSDMPDDDAASAETVTSAAFEAEQSSASAAEQSATSETAQSAAAPTACSVSDDNSPSATGAEASEKLEAIRAEAYARRGETATCGVLHQSARGRRKSRRQNARHAARRAISRLSPSGILGVIFSSKPLSNTHKHNPPINH